MFGSEESLQQVAQCLDHAHFLHRCDLLELARPDGVQEDRDILVKQDGQVGPFRLDFTALNPAGHIPEKKDSTINVLKW